MNKPINHTKLINQKDKCSFVDPELRYLSKEQAEEWIKIGKFTNTHTLSTENQLLKQNLLKIFPDQKTPLVIVDLGCGDGRKATQLIKDLFENEYNVKKYIAVDVSRILINEAVRNITQNTKLTQNNCLYICSPFREVSKNLSILLHRNKLTNVVYLFLGNTFNNFEKQDIVKILKKIVPTNSQLLIGMKYRKNSSQEEQQRIVNEYSSLGTSFTFSFGHLLELSDQEMNKIVHFNPEKNVLEIYLEVKKPSNAILQLNLADCKKIHVFNSYKPTVREIKEFLSGHFKKISVLNNSSTFESVFVCKR